MSSRGEWRETKWVCTTHLEPAVASKAASEEPDRFARAVTALERALDVAKSTGDFASVHSRFQPTSQFFSARTGLRPEDLTRCAHVAIDVMHAVDGDVSSQARWGTMATRVMETHGKRLRLSVDWRPLHRLLRAYLDGDSEGYNGAIPLAVHQAVVSRLARKSRRHFADAPAQIWAMLEPEIRAVDTADCFEGLGMLNLLMPSPRVGDDDDTNPWDEWVGTRVRMSQWMHTNSFWLAAWHAIFAQLAKHDVRGRIDWSKHPRAHAHHVAVVHGIARGGRGRSVPVRPAVADEGDVLVQQVCQRGRDARQDSRQGYGVQAGYHVRGYGEDGSARTRTRWKPSWTWRRRTRIPATTAGGTRTSLSLSSTRCGTFGNAARAGATSTRRPCPTS